MPWFVVVPSARVYFLHSGLLHHGVQLAMANRVTKVREVVEVDDSLLPEFKKAAGGVSTGCF